MGTLRQGDLLVFIFVCQGVQMFMSYDGGATPASLDCIANTTAYLDWHQTELGLLGSIDKFGITFSSALWGRLLQIFPAKPLLLVGLGLNTFATFCFGHVHSKWIMFGAKVCMGLTQALQAVWSLCWVLAWAPENHRTMWLGLGSVAAGVGNGIGTAVAGFATSMNLPYSFAYKVESSALGALLLVLVLMPGSSLALEQDIGTLELTAEQDTEQEQELQISVASPPATYRSLPCEPPSATWPQSSRWPKPRDTPSRQITSSSAFPADQDLVSTRSRSKSNWTLDAQAFRSRRARIATGFSKTLDAPHSAPNVSTRDNPSDLKRLRRQMRTMSVSLQLSMSGLAQKSARARTVSTFNMDVPILPPPATDAEILENPELGEDTWSQLRTLFYTPLYLRTALSLAAIMFVTSGVQFIWVRLFVTAWRLDKGYVITGMLLSTGVGGSVGVAYGPAAVDRCGGFDTAQGRFNSLKLMSKMIVGAVVGAAIGLSAIVGHVQLTYNEDGSALSGSKGDAHIYVFCIGMCIMFASFNGCMAGLTGLNISALDQHQWSFGSGVSVSLQNLLGCSMGPLLPGLVMDHLGVDPDNPYQTARALCYGTAVVLFGTLLCLFFLMAAWRTSSLELMAEEFPHMEDESEDSTLEQSTGHSGRYSRRSPNIKTTIPEDSHGDAEEESEESESIQQRCF